MLAMGWTAAPGLERAKTPEAATANEPIITLEGVAPAAMEKLRTEGRRIVDIAEKLRRAEDPLKAQAFVDQVQNRVRQLQNGRGQPPGWLNSWLQNYDAVKTRKELRKIMSVSAGVAGAVGGPVGTAASTGIGAVLTVGLDKAMLRKTDRMAWERGCGGNAGCLMWAAETFVEFELDGNVTPELRKYSADLKFLPTNSKLDAYDEPSQFGLSQKVKLLDYFERRLRTIDPAIPEPPEPTDPEKAAHAQKNVLKIAEEKLEQKLSRETFEERIAEVGQAERRETGEGPLEKYQRIMVERVEREIRADIYRSLGTFVSFADPELGRVIAIGFPAAERLGRGIDNILSGVIDLASFGDVLGGAAALTQLVAGLGTTEDALARNMRMIQRGLGTVSDQVHSVDRKVIHVIEQLNDIAIQVAETHQEVLELRLRMEKLHRKVDKWGQEHSADIAQIAVYLKEANKNVVLDRMDDVDTCANVNQQTLLLGEQPDQRTRFLECRDKAFKLARSQATRNIYTGIVEPTTFEEFLTLSPRYDGEGAHWLPALWSESAATIARAKEEARERPTKYRGIFDEDEAQVAKNATARTRLAAVAHAQPVNPTIWHEGVRQYARLEQHRVPGIPADDTMTRKLIDSAEDMKEVLRAIDDGNLAYGALELHLWNSHLVIQVLRQRWADYLATKEHKFTTCSKKVLEQARHGTTEQNCHADLPYGWLGNNDLVFDYWLNDYDERYLPREDAERIQAMVRLLKANDEVRSKEVEIESPVVHYDEDVKIVTGQFGNELFQPGFWAQLMSDGPTEFPAIYGDVEVSWTGCTKVGVEHRMKDRRPFGTEIKWACVGDEHGAGGSIVRWEEFLKGGQLKRSFRRPDGETRATWCTLAGEASFLRSAEYRGQAMIEDWDWTMDGHAKIREGSLVLNQLGLTLGWDREDGWYRNSDIKRDAARLTRYEAGPAMAGGQVVRSKCSFHALWGIEGVDWLLPNLLTIEENIDYRGVPPKTREDGKPVERYTKHMGSILLFEPTKHNIEYVENNLSEIVFNQEVEKIFHTVKREMVQAIRSTGPGTRYIGDTGEREKTVVDVAEYEFAAAQTMASFGEWAAGDVNLRRTVELDWHEVVGLPSPAWFRISLGDALNRLDESWKAVQVLLRVASGSCSATPGGASLEELTRNLASGTDITNFLKRSETHQSRFESWTDLRKHGLLGASSAGLTVDAARLKERIGALDSWPLQTETRLLTYGEGTIVLASVEAAMEIIRDAARRSGVVIASESDTENRELDAVQIYGRALATMPKEQLEGALVEREIGVIIGSQDIEIVNASLLEKAPTAEMATSNAVGVPIAWRHAEKEISALGPAVRKAGLAAYGDDKSGETAEAEKEVTDTMLRVVQERIVGVLSGTMCRPGIYEFDEGMKLLESLTVH